MSPKVIITVKQFNNKFQTFLFHSIGVIRYLGGRFPETTSATDNENRTPLHYAATVKDNGHFYNLLMHLGANPKSEDNVSISIYIQIVS